MAIKGVLFDFDGVVVDTESIWLECVFEYTSLHSILLTKEELIPFIGCGDFVLKNRLIKSLSSEERYLEAYQWMRNLYNQRVKDLKPRDGVVNWLKQIREAGLFAMIVSNSDNDSIMQLLKEFEIIEYFDDCVTPNHINQMKPNPDLYLEALKIKNCNPDQAICIEDSLYGLLAAESAGIYCVLAPTELTKDILLTFKNPKINMRDMTFFELSDLIGLKLNKPKH